MGKAGRLSGRGDRRGSERHRGSRRRGRPRPDSAGRAVLPAAAPRIVDRTDRQLLRDGLVALGGAPPAAGTLEAVERYLNELLLWSGRTDLVKFGDVRELIVRHVLDSLAPAPLIEQALAEGGLAVSDAGVCDVGSGAGFPGVPLALCLPFGSVRLLERSAARAAFLRTVCALIARPGLAVIEADLARTDERFDLLLVRALSPFNGRTIAGLRRILAPRGVLFVYQGRRESAAAVATRLRLQFADVRTVPVRVPLLDAERHVIVARSVTVSC